MTYWPLAVHTSSHRSLPSPDNHYRKHKTSCPHLPLTVNDHTNLRQGKHCLSDVTDVTDDFTVRTCAENYLGKRNVCIFRFIIIIHIINNTFIYHYYYCFILLLLLILFNLLLLLLLFYFFIIVYIITTIIIIFIIVILLLLLLSSSSSSSWWW